MSNGNHPKKFQNRWGGGHHKYQKPPQTFTETFIKKVGPKIVGILLLVVAKALTDPLIHASKSSWMGFRKNILEPKLNMIYETLGIPKDPHLRIGLDQFVFEHIPEPDEQKSLFRVERLVPKKTS